VRGSVGDAEHIPPEELPDCDILEMNCDGTEIDILSGIEIRPDKIIVEAHGKLGTPPEDVRVTLTELGYETIRSDVHSKESGISLLTAVRSDLNSG
jgi:hypothetical protein